MHLQNKRDYFMMSRYLTGLWGPVIQLCLPYKRNSVSSTNVSINFQCRDVFYPLFEIIPDSPSTPAHSGDGLGGLSLLTRRKYILIISLFSLDAFDK